MTRAPASAPRSGPPWIQQKQKASPKSLIRSLKYLKPHLLTGIGGVLALLVSSGGSLAIPRLTQSVIDRGITLRNPRLVLTSAIAIVVISITRSVFTFLQGYLAAKTSQGVAFDMRNKLYSHIQHLSFSYHDKTQTGQLLTRATSDVDLVRTFVGTGLLQLLSAILLMVGSIVLLFGTNWKLTLIVLPLMVATLPVFGLFAKKGRPLFIAAQEKLASLNTRLQEAITGITVVKAFTREQHESKQFKSYNEELRNLQLRAAKIFAIGIPLIFSMANLSTLVLVWVGGRQVFSGALTIGELVAFQSYLMLTMFPILMLGGLVMSVASASAGAERIFEILDAESEVKEKPGAGILPQAEASVLFEEVTFKYAGMREPALQKVSFEANPGETIALLGSTGSGKSTIINLIPRFYDVSSGRITIGGIDIRDVTIESLRKQIGIVLQETVLFGTTIRENLAYGKPDATDEEIQEVSVAAEAHDFIMAYPDGYETAVGERGVTLSGGQKQRIAIARALLVDPKILILDDSTSSIDFATESKIQAALTRLRKNRLSFVIAQRISTVMDADLILVVDQGKVVARGDHSSLIQVNPLYAEIYYSQLQRDNGNHERSSKKKEAT